VGRKASTFTKEMSPTPGPDCLPTSPYQNHG
jgi:hypothetical protein